MEGSDIRGVIWSIWKSAAAMDLNAVRETPESRTAFQDSGVMVRVPLMMSREAMKAGTYSTVMLEPHEAVTIPMQ